MEENKILDEQEVNNESSESENDNVVVEEQEVSKTKKILRYIGKGFEYFCYAILAVLFVVVGWLTIDKFILKSPVPSLFGYSTLLVETGSMSGTIEEDDMILIKKTDDYELTDIVTFMKEGDIIPTTHRIIKIVEGGYITKGDANDDSDTGFVTDEEIIGEVIDIYENVGVFTNWIKEENGWIYIIGIIGILFGGIYLLKNEKD